MFGKKLNLIGVDIGSFSIKVVEMKGKKDGFILKNIAEFQLPEDVISEGIIVDYGEVVNALNAIFTEKKFSHKKVAAALKGNSVITKKLTIPSVDDKNFRETFRWEAAQYIQMDIDEVNMDFEILSRTEELEQTEVVLAVAKKDLIADMVSVLESAKLKPVLIDLEVFALLNAFEVNYGIDSEVSAVVNIGHTTSIIVFVKNGLFEFSREINIGGKNAIHIIQQKLGMTIEEASQIIKDKESIEFNEELQAAIRQFCEDVAFEVKNSIDMFLTSTQLPTSKCYISGSVGLYGMRDTLEEKLDIEVNYFNPFANIEIAKGIDTDFLNDNLYRFNVAVGLALRKVDDK
jgi:type IV pilus assembly protein PilM